MSARTIKEGLCHTLHNAIVVIKTAERGKDIVWLVILNIENVLNFALCMSRTNYVNDNYMSLEIMIQDIIEEAKMITKNYCLTS